MKWCLCLKLDNVTYLDDTVVLATYCFDQVLVVSLYWANFRTRQAPQTPSHPQNPPTVHLQAYKFGQVSAKARSVSVLVLFQSHPVVHERDRSGKRQRNDWSSKSRPKGKWKNKSIYFSNINGNRMAVLATCFWNKTVLMRSLNSSGYS